MCHAKRWILCFFFLRLGSASITTCKTEAKNLTNWWPTHGPGEQLGNIDSCRAGHTPTSKGHRQKSCGPKRWCSEGALWCIPGVGWKHLALTIRLKLHNMHALYIMSAWGGVAKPIYTAYSDYLCPSVWVWVWYQEKLAKTYEGKSWAT